MDSDPVINNVLREQAQGHETRQRLFRALGKALGRPVVTLFTSFRFPVIIEDSDADMLEGVLQKLDLSSGLALMLSSPGGDGLAAERIVNVCRAHSGTGEFWAIVPGKAKSAATMVCFGASKILMGPTSELGPVDPQVPVEGPNGVKWFSAHNVIRSYRELFEAAVKETGKLEPYLQQLANYDAREVKEMESAMALAEDISATLLASGMMQGVGANDVKQRIQMFLSPEKTKTHGRPIYRQQAAGCGLAIEEQEVKDRAWNLVYELYIRTNWFVSNRVSKCIESELHSFVAAKPARSGGANE